MLLLKSEGVRMGTHDHYSDQGVETTRWFDLAAPYVAHGDGMMKPLDRGSASFAARLSLHEVLEAMNDPAFARARLARFADIPATLNGSFNACTEAHPLAGLMSVARADGPLNDVIELEPVPSAANPEPPQL